MDPWTPPARTGPTWIDKAERVTKFRDVLLAVGGVLYVLGYCSWALYAWKQGLGVLPAIEGQYFVAGIIPGILLGLLLAVVGALLPSIRRRLTRFDPAHTRVSRRLMNSGAILFILAWIGEWWWPGHGIDGWLISAGAIALLAGGTYGGSESRLDRATGWLTYWYLAGALPAVLVAVFFVYVDRVFPVVPGELGGPRVQCVELDIAAEQLAPVTLQTLGAASDTAPRVIRTHPLNLWYRGGGFLIVSPSASQSSKLRISEDAVTATVGSADCKP